MTDRLPFGQAAFGSYRTSRFARIPRPLGCLLALILCPLLVVASLVTLVLLLLPWGRRRFARIVSPGAAPASSPREQALLRLVRSFAAEEGFTAEEARQSGLPVEAGATVDDLLTDALERRWIEVSGDRLRVTERGRRASG